MKGSEYVALAAAKMPEAELDENVRATCKALRLDLAYHTWRSIHSTAGFPDWIICGRRGILVRENKRHGKNPTEEQQAWLDGFAAHGMDVGVWRPEDWISGRILRELQAIA